MVWGHCTSPTTMAARGTQGSKLILLISALLCPPLPVFLLDGVTKQLAFSVLLTVVGFHFAGIAYSLYYIWPYLTDKISLNNEDDIEQGDLLSPSAPSPTLSADETPPSAGNLYISSPQDTALPPSYSDATGQSSQNGNAALEGDVKIQH